MRRNRTHQAPQERVIITRRRLAFPLLLAAIRPRTAAKSSPQSTSYHRRPTVASPTAAELEFETRRPAASRPATSTSPAREERNGTSNGIVVTDRITIALHLVVSAFCGGIFCVWGEGVVTFVYVERETTTPAQNTSGAA